jgi:sugar lactone lactonase YvrE
MRQHILSALLAATLVACGGGTDSSNPSTPSPPPAPTPLITLVVPSGPLLAGGAPLTLSATLSEPAGITWALAKGAPGALSSASGATVNYLPPADIAAPTTVTVVVSAGASRMEQHLTLYPNPGPAGIRLLAGSSGSAAVLDGLGSGARLRHITSMAGDGKGNAYLIDDNALRQVTAGGAVHTVRDFTDRRGDDVAGGAFASALAMATGADGQLYVLWSATWLPGRMLSRVDNLGQLTDLFPLPLPTVSTVTEATTYQPSGLLAVAGNFYISYRQHLARVSGDGALTLLAGSASQAGQVDGNGAQARFSDVRDMAAAADGTLYLIDGSCLRSVTSSGAVHTVAGACGMSGEAARDGTGSAARFSAPQSLTVQDNGVVLVLDRSPDAGSAYAIRAVSAQGQVITMSQLKDDPLASPTRWLRTTSNGNFMLGAGSRVQRYRPSDGGVVSALAGREDDSDAPRDGAASVARFMRPVDLGADGAGNVYVLDQTFELSDPARDSKDLVLRRIAVDGQVTTLVKQRLGRASSLLVDEAGNAYVTVLTGSAPLPTAAALYRVLPGGAVQLVAGQPLAGGAASVRDGAGIAASFNQPQLLGFDAQGNLYARDVTAEQVGIVRQITPAGQVSTVASAPPEVGRAPDGNSYLLDVQQRIVAIDAQGQRHAYTNFGYGNNVSGPLPGPLSPRGRVLPYGPHALAVIAGNAVYRIVLPH